MPQKRSSGGKAAAQKHRPGRMGTKDLERLFASRGFTDVRWIDPADIVTAEWVRMKCRFGCREYGRNAACPPNTPPVTECARFFQEYRRAAVFHFPKKVDRPEDRHAWTRKLNLELIKLEQEVFKAGFFKAFLLFFDSCGICLECAAARAECKEPKLARPTPESLGVDVFTTVRKIGYPIETLSQYDQQMNRYAFLLID
jgi:predicted metal-binding protein